MSTLHAVELGVLGPLQVRRSGAPVAIPGAKPRAILTMLGLHGGSVVAADTLLELLWGVDPPRTAAKALQTHISALRRTLGDGFVLTQGTGWILNTSETDASRYKLATRTGRDAAAAGETSQAVARFEEALALWRGIPELPDTRRGISEKTRWVEGHAALVEDRADALLATGRAAEIIGELEAAVAEAPLRERRWGQLMLALYRAGRQGEALAAYQRARSLLVDELGVDPGPELRRLEAAVVAQDAALDMPVAQNLSTVTRAVTFLLTDIEGSTAAWEADADAMAVALARHDELVEQVVTSRGGRLIKTRGEGDATFSVFDRPSAAAAAAIELQDGIAQEPWALREPMRIRIALHTGEAELRDGDYFGRAVNRAARLRSLADGGQILCSGATAELVIDSLRDDVVLADLGMRQLKSLARPEHVFELRLETAERPEETSEAPLERPGLPAVLIGPGPFVGRSRELEGLMTVWQTALTGGMHAILIAGEPGVGKTRLAGEWSHQAYGQGAVVLYGRCDEDLGAPYQPFAEALRALVPCIGAKRLRGLRGVEALLALVPGLTDVLPDLSAPTRADPDTERYALFDAVVGLLELASASAPVVLILDDLHWAAKPTLLLLRHLLRFGDHARVQIVGTYRSTDLDRSHPLAAMLADLHRDGSANRLALSGLDEDDVTAYVTEAGYDDEELARALASVTGGNPFFLIEALRHVDESGGIWDPSTLPQGVRETVSRRLSRLSAETNKALAAAAVVGSRFDVDLVEGVVEQDLVDAFDEACKAGIIIEEPGGRYRFNHAIVRQSLLAELASVRRMRLHQRIAATLETQPGADDELLAELAHHYFECAWAGNAVKAVEYCRRAADQAMARLGYEGAAELYDRALHALEEIDDELPDRGDQAAELLIARCEALLAAGDVASAAGAVSQLQAATVDSARLAAWATCFDGELSMLAHPERLDQIEAALGAAAEKLAGLDDAAGEAKAHTVRAGCLARLGRIADCEIALDEALTAARRAREHRRVNAVLAGAPLAALWGPNPVPRAGGRCLDVVRLLRITTDSPAVEATSTRCQAVLEAFRGRGAAARRMIDSARRTVTELGLRHALLEVEQFAGIVELVIDDPAAAEPHLRKAYNGFRRMGLDADTAETAALLGRTCLALNRDAEADELCTESERLAGNALKPSIAWRTLRARLLSLGDDHDGARRVAEAAVSIAERTDALVDHGDACLTLATVLGAAGDVAGARAAAERAADLYERKGAAALAERARDVLGERVPPPGAAPTQAPAVEFDTAAVRFSKRVMNAVDREDWDEFDRLIAPDCSIESRRKIVGFAQTDLPSDEVMRQTRRDLETGAMRVDQVVIAVRGERLALARTILSTPDVSPGAPSDEFLQLYGIDGEGRIVLQVWFDLEDMDAAIAELDTLHARLEVEQPSARQPRTTLSRLAEQFSACFAARDWVAMADLFAEDVCVEDRRHTVNARIRRGRDTEIEDLQASAEVGFTDMTSVVLATRGGHLSLNRFSVGGQQQEELVAEAFHVVEIDADERFAAVVIFDFDDFDAAIAELDARYLAGEAADHARTWSVITDFLVAHNRREITATTTDVVTIDHRRAAAFAPGDGIDYIRAGWDLDQTLNIYIETAHRVNDLGAVFTWAGHGASREGFTAPWRGVSLMTVGGEMVSRMEVFDEEDLDVALAAFDQLSRPAPRLENAASRAYQRLWQYFAARDWAALADTIAQDVYDDDHRQVVNSGVRHGRDALIVNLRAVADLGTTDVTPVVIATRGERLVLASVRLPSGGEGPDAFYNEVLRIIEINPDERIAAAVMFDLDDFDAAVAELDARYLAGEAAAHAHTWSLIARTYAGFNRGELPAATQNWVNVDHRRAAAYAPGEGAAYFRASWELATGLNVYIEAVHRLSDLGAVFTHVGKGTSRDGFAAEWRTVDMMTVDGDLISRVELFDEADLDAALAKFDQLSRPAPRLENAANRVSARYRTYFTTRNWDSLGGILADEFSSDDRRRMVGSGVRHGRDAEIADLRAIADLGLTNMASTVVATRGEHLVLTRVRFSGSDLGPEAIVTDILGVIEVDVEERITATVVFDPEDMDAAFAELDARYLAGEAATHARTWSIVAGGYAALNRHEIPATTTDFEDIDHRRGAAFAPGDLIEYLRAGWDLDQDIKPYIEAVHQLRDLGAVVTHAAYGSSREGFDAEWREVTLFTTDGNAFNRCELFDEEDLDAALAKFDQLSQLAPRLDNAASRTYERFQKYFAAGSYDALAEILTDDFAQDDRRRVIGAGLRRGRDAQIADIRAFAGIGANKSTATVIATRGERLVLCRSCIYSEDHEPGASRIEFFSVIEITADERIAARSAFDLDDVDAAIAELDGRYLGGEAAPYARTWSVITRAYAAGNRNELPAATPDWVTIDHRRGRAFEPGELATYMHATWDIIPNTTVYIESVHRLSHLGAVVTHAVHGTSRDGFDADWREVAVLMVDGDRLSRSELFDEADMDTALARFDELRQPAPGLENAASQAYERFRRYFAARDWAAMAELLTVDTSVHDHRRVVNAETRRGRDVEIANMQAFADVGAKRSTATVIATRGERLVLCRTCISGEDQQPGASRLEFLNVVEITADERIAARNAFDLDDFDAAFEELDARYLAGEAAPHAHTWSVIAGCIAGLNPHELPPVTPDSVYIDHRAGQRIEAVDFAAYIRSALDQAPDIRICIEAVHRLSPLGAVFTWAGHGSSHEGFYVEWRGIEIMMVDGDLASRAEVFDEADLDAALSRFEELHPRAPRPENAASRMLEQVFTHFAARDWIALAELVAEDICSEDRRSVVNAGIRHGRDAEIADMRAIAGVGVTHATLTVMATRGEHLTLCRVLLPIEDHAPESFRNEALCLVEINADNRVTARILFDVDDMDGAFEELDARYISGEAAAYSHTWSVIAGIYAAFNRHELPAADWVTIDHRRGTPFASARITESVRAIWDLTPDLNIQIEAVHRLGKLGAVITHTQHGTSLDGFEAEWRQIQLLTVDGKRIDRCEIFDEEDLDAALARFEELHPRSPRRENAVMERALAHLVARDWDAVAQDFAENYYCDDRRRVVNAGLREGREAAVEDLWVSADIGTMANITLDIIATRGERRLLTHWHATGPDPGAVEIDVLQVIEHDDDERIATAVLFDVDDIDTAFEELDARYLAGEAAPYAQTWSVISGVYAAMNRHELFPTTPDWVNVDHRRPRIIEEGGLNASLESLWQLIPDVCFRVEAVHRLTNLGAVCSHVAQGVSHDGFHAEWRGIEVMTVDGDLISRCEIFDEADLDAALTRFDELPPQPRRLENTASQVEQRFMAHFAKRNWDAIAELIADDCRMDDRRRTVNSGVSHDRDGEIASLRAIAEVGVTSMTPTVIAIRGERLALSHYFVSDDWGGTTVLSVLEINAENKIVARVGFDADDFDAAITELDARYVVGEAAAHSATWRVIEGIQAAVNRRELPAMTTDPGYIDHRPVVSVEGAELAESIRAVFEIFSAYRVYVEAVHRLDELGAVYTQVHNGTSLDGVDAELRMIEVQTVEGDLLSRAEVFDEADLDAALTRFDELHPQTPRLENAASRLYDRSNAYLAARDWDAIAELVADDVSTDDRRRVVGGGTQRGRDAQIANMRAVVDLGVRNFESVVIATRGERLALTRTRVSGGDQRPEAFSVEMLNIVEIDADNRFAAAVQFDPDDLEAALAELEARYVAGEASAHADIWSVVAAIHAAVNRGELPAMTPDHVYIDHRPLVSVEGLDARTSIGALRDLTAAVSVYVETLHRLDNLGVVVTQIVKATTHEGLDTELRMIAVATVEGELCSRIEYFDEADRDVALARFEELHPQLPRVENAASRADDRFLANTRARNWVGVAEILADNTFVHDRRRVVNIGVWDGRDTVIANFRALAEALTDVTSTAIAIRGERLALIRIFAPNRNLEQGDFGVEMLGVVELGSDDRITAHVMFDPDNINAALEELESRYLAGEAGEYQHTWSVIAQTYAAYARHELPAAYLVNVDHRRGTPFATDSDVTAVIRARRELTPDFNMYIEAVHQLTKFGAVITHTSSGTSKEGFDAEWRMIQLLTIDGDRIDRCEMFDETDLDTAIARFEELQPHARLPENAASRAIDRFYAYFRARNWAAIAEILTDDSFIDDRHDVVNSGFWDGRNAVIANLQALAEAAPTTSSVIATRGEHLALTRISSPNRDVRHGEFSVEMLVLTEIDSDERIAAQIAFDVDDIDSAFEELDARYLAGEAAGHSRTWSAIASGYAALNRHEIPPTTPDFVNVDHRRGRAFEPGDMIPFISATWKVIPDGKGHIEAVHRLSDLGVVVTHTFSGTSQEGFNAEWREITLLTVDGDLVNRGEMFDETDLAAALARFDELDRQAPLLENASTRTWARLVDAYNHRDMSGFLALMTEDARVDDRRKGLRATLDGLAVWKNVQHLFQAAISWRLRMEPIAIRGSHLSLTRHCIRDVNETDQPITWEALCVMEVDEDNLMRDQVIFDPDNINDAFAELTARWIASGEVAHPEVIETHCRFTETFNRHDWEALAEMSAGTQFVDRRQLAAGGTDRMTDHMASIMTMASLVPDLWIEPAEILTHSASGIVTHIVEKGTSTQGVAIELPFVILILFDGDRVTRVEAFDLDQRDVALARFEEIGRPD